MVWVAEGLLADILLKVLKLLPSHVECSPDPPREREMYSYPQEGIDRLARYCFSIMFDHYF